MFNIEDYIVELKQNFSIYSFDFSFFNNKVVLFTGANGLIGKYFIDTLMLANKIFNLNINVIATDINIDKLVESYQYEQNIEIIKYDVNEKFVYESDINFIIHAASPASPYFFANYPVQVITANVIGTNNMLSLAKEKNAKIIYISSGEIYGMQQCPQEGYTEDMPGIVDSSIQRSCYTESKRCSETLVVSYANQYNVDATVARLCYVYGPTYNETEDRVIFQFIKSALHNEDILLKSSGQQKRSYCYVSDVVFALFSIFKNGQKAEVYNIANKNSNYSIYELANIVSSLSRRSQFIMVEASKKEKASYSPFANAIQNPRKVEQIGWEAKVSIEDGIKKIFKVKDNFK